MMFEVSLCDWFGMGFGVNMSNMDMLLFKVNHINNTLNNQTSFIVEVHDMWGVGNLIPDDDTMRGGTMDWIVIG